MSELIFKREVLANTLSFVKSAIPKKELEPVLNNVMFKILDESKVQVSSSDLDLMAVAEAPCEVFSKGEFTLPGEKLINLVNKLAAPTVKIKVDDEAGEAYITSGLYSGTYKTLPTDKFPTAREITSHEKLVSFKKPELLNGLRRIQFSVNTDEARKNLSAVKISHDGLLSSNGKITSLYRDDFGVDELFVSSSSLSDLLIVLEASETSDIDVYADDAFVCFKFADNVFFTRKITIQFPDVVKRIDGPTKEKNNIKIKFNVKELKAAIGRISLTSNQESNSIRFLMKGEFCELSSTDSKGFSSSEEVKVISSENVPENFIFRFNYEYILSIMCKWSLEDIEFALNENIRMPARVDEGAFTCFIMQLVE